MDGVEIIVPLGLFTSIAVSVIAAMYFGHKTRKSSYEALQTALQTAAQRGEPVSPALVKAIRVPVRPQKADLRRGVILLSIALGFVALGAAIALSEDGARDAFWPMVGTGAFPGVVGLAFLLLHLIAPSDDD